MSGYCAVGSLVIATYPAIVVRIAMTIATIGRRTKRAPMRLLPGLRGRRTGGARGRRAPGLLRDDRHARPDPLDALDDDPVAGLQALLDDPLVAVDGSGLDDLDGDLVVRADDADLVAPLELGDGALRNDDRALLDVHRDAHLGVLARAEEVAGIREGARELDRAGLDVDL